MNVPATPRPSRSWSNVDENGHSHVAWGDRPDVVSFAETDFRRPGPRRSAVTGSLSSDGW